MSQGVGVRVASLVVMLVCGWAFSAAAAELTVTVTGLRSDEGALRVGVFADPQEFPEGPPLSGQIALPSKGQVTVVFDGLPAGRYAVFAHHDENGNGRVDKGPSGMAQEGLGFSNGAAALVGAPPFGEAEFDLPEEGRHVLVAVEY